MIKDRTLGLLVIVIFAAIVACWLIQVTRIGLHGDESWFGLKALHYLHHGIDRPFGLQRYTGILQSILNAVVFKYFGVGVAQLRVPGVIINSIALALLVFICLRKQNRSTALLLLLLFAQSALYMSYAAVAWEVCSFTLICLSLAIVSLDQLTQASPTRPLIFVFIFLLSSIVGVYNHILFSSVLLALLAGILCWTCTSRIAPGPQTHTVVSLLIITNCNAGLVYGLTHNWMDAWWNTLGVLAFAIVPPALIAQTLWVCRYPFALDWVSRELCRVRLPRIAMLGFLAFCVAAFLRYQSIMVVQLFSQKILFLRVYSYTLPGWSEVALLISGSLILACLAAYLITDVLSPDATPAPFVLLCYGGILCLYTLEYSIRYFLLLCALTFMYLAFRISRRGSAFERITSTVLISAVIVSTVLVQGHLHALSADTTRAVKAQNFTIGASHRETSAHFLPFSPVLDFLHKNKIGRFEMSERFFIGNNLLFYRDLQPVIYTYPNKARIEYDYESPGTGFRMQRID